MQPSRIVRSALTVTLVLFVGLSVNAQDPDHMLSITSAMDVPGSSVTLANIYDNTSSVDIAGWTLGNCSDGALVMTTEVLEGQATIDLGGAAFFGPAIVPGGCRASASPTGRSLPRGGTSSWSTPPTRWASPRSWTCSTPRNSS